MRRRISFVLGAIIVGGCTVGPDYQPPQIDLPPRFEAPSASQMPPIDLAEWWHGFHDPALDQLVSEAIQNNLSLKIVAQRIVVARADRDAVAAAESPTINATASGFNNRESEKLHWPKGLGEYKTYQFGLEGSWEIDLFGGTRRAIEAADAQTGVVEEDKRAAMVALLGELAADYAILRSDQHRLDIARRNISAQSNAFDLSRRALAAGLGTEVDVSRAEAELRISEAMVPELEGGVSHMCHAIAVLLGRFPEDLKTEVFDSGKHELSPPPLPSAVPSDVLRNRPDIRRAERQIAAATARVGVATADLFPKFKIPLGIAPTASNFGALPAFEALNWTLGAAASQNIFDGGRADARVQAAEAIAEADRLAYRQTVLEAFREIEDRLTGYDVERRRQISLAAAVAREREAFDQITRLYARGLVDFYKVLDSERAVFHAEDSLAQSELNQTLDIIGLYRGLGGGLETKSALRSG